MPDIKYKPVPEIPTEEQWGGLAHDIMLWMDSDCEQIPRALFQHLERLGRTIPDWFEQETELKNLDHTISKGTRVTLIYRAMLQDAPKPILSDPSILTS